MYKHSDILDKVEEISGEGLKWTQILSCQCASLIKVSGSKANLIVPINSERVELEGTEIVHILQFAAKMNPLRRKTGFAPAKTHLTKAKTLITTADYIITDADYMISDADYVITDAD